MWISSHLSVCQLLEHLHLRDSKVTEFGLHIAVRGLKKLRFLDHQLPIPDNERNVRQPTAHLKSFMCSRHGIARFTCTIPLSSDGMHSTKKYSSTSLSDVVIAGVFDVMANFNHHKRSVYRRNLLITFNGGVVPYLARFGQPLQRLKFYRFQGLELEVVFMMCPRLRKLTLLWNSSYVSTLPIVTIPTCLEHFKFVGELDSEMDGNCGDISTVLLAPSLKTVYIENCPNLDDEMIQNAFKKHQFETLESLTLINCENVGKDVFEKAFLCRLNALKSMKLVFCHRLCTVANQEEWARLAGGLNFDLKIELIVP